MLQLGALLALLGAAYATPDASGNVVCFGDSWAAMSCDALQEVVSLHLKPNKVVDRGVSGSTAWYWANNTELMLASLATADPKWIWLSIGGDDILGYCKSGMCGNGLNTTAINSLIYQSLDTMLSAMVGLDPLIQIVIFGYDFTNFIGTTECIALSQVVFPGMTSQLEINSVFLSYTANVVAPLAIKYAPWVTYVDLWGTLQAAGGSSLTPPPYPNIAYPSPEYLMSDGCIHASQQGWQTLMGALYNNYFANRL